MRTIKKLLERVKVGNSGQTALEYALVIAVVAAVIVGAAMTMFGKDGEGVRDKVFKKSIDHVSDVLDESKKIAGSGG